MDIEFIYRQTRFIADKQKAKMNPIKHNGVTFQMAAEAFYDPMFVTIDASRKGEERGIRIISARKATLKEEAMYDLQ